MAPPIPKKKEPEPVKKVEVPPREDVKKTKPKPDEETKKDFVRPTETKKDFGKPSQNEEEEPEFDRDSDIGRWRPDELVRSLVVYRWEFKRWPDDLEDKENHPTGIESYYEVRYFKEGTNKKGEKYADLYGKHRAKRDFWIDETCQQRAINPSQMGLSTDESNVVPFTARRTSGAR